MLIQTIDELTDEISDLIEQSRQYQKSIYPADSIYQVDPQALIGGEMYFVGVYDEEMLGGIGAVIIQQDDARYGEIKNLFVNPVFRGRGVAKTIMQALEQYLIDNNVTVSRLETGVHQPESVSLYHRLGYKNRSAFGVYESDPLSIYMEKKLL